MTWKLGNTNLKTLTLKLNDFKEEKKKHLKRNLQQNLWKRTSAGARDRKKNPL